MHVINARNVNDAYAQALHYLFVHGEEEASRNGPVVVAPAPVTTVYDHPTERVLFSPVRDANPFFHLMESLWMLAGRDDLAFPLWFNSHFKDYSDDGITIHGAYGHRWRRHFGTDQLLCIGNELFHNPESRRCVLQMWSAALDLGKPYRDVPCNTHVYFDCRHGRLNMTVCNRSNDALWGAYGANAVHMSMLQEFLAAYIGVPVGIYRQMSNNLHLYQATMPAHPGAAVKDAHDHNYYITKGACRPYPLVDSNETAADFLLDLEHFFEKAWGQPYRTEYFRGVVLPMYEAWAARKDKTGTGLEETNRIVAEDWRIACTNWINRREAK